ncbi:Holliday junction recognition protein [Mesocricetus auratus]|uniref:Holliday junction recognition protein n=1 Tax=Mesocricetus auratus TaxID=10036 RepID=A0A1U8CGE7_MESAU|nr:Holliday junction recognition protein [Mesocricetus auratus]
MDPEGQSDNRLLQHLKESSSRFQTLMQRLIAKYDQPFEDDPLVQMSTLTYETPQGLRVWGGKLIKERNEAQTQDPSVKMITRLNRQALDGNERLQSCTQALGDDSESSGTDTSLDEEEKLSCTLTPTVPGSPLKNDLRWKYLTQVDILLQDEEYFKNAEKRNGKDTLVTLVSSSCVTPAPGCQDSISTKSCGSPEMSALSSRDWNPSNPCQADMTVTPRNDSFSFLGTSSSSLSSQPLEADDICNVTVSDLYEGMMHSMSRLLSLKPSCIISTKTYINQNWNPRRRLSRKSGMHMNRTYSHRSKRFQRNSKKEPCSKLGKEVLRDCKNLLHTAPHKTDLNLERGSLEGSKLQVHKFNPVWKEFQVMPRKYLDLNTMYCHERENRMKTLQWLISPVKVVPRQRMLPSRAEKWYREIEMKFDKLHQECSLSSGKQLPLAGPTESWAVDVYRGSSRSPGSPQGIKTPRLHSPFNREKMKRSSEAFEDLNEMSVKVDSCLPRSHSTVLLSGDSTSSGLFLQGLNSGSIRETLSPSTGISAPWTSPRGHGRNRYDEIKEEFDKLYQKYCLSPRQVKVTSCVTASPKKVGASVPSHIEDLRKLNPDSGFLSSPKLSTSGWNIRSPQDSIPTEAQMSAWTVSAVMRDPCFPTKRRKLSYPPMCAHQTKTQDSSGAAGKAMPWPEKQANPVWPDC